MTGAKIKQREKSAVNVSENNKLGITRRNEAKRKEKLDHKKIT